MSFKRYLLAVCTVGWAASAGCGSEPGSSTRGKGTAGSGAGNGAAGTGAAGTGTAGTGAAGTGAAGTGAAGTGSAGTGSAGTGSAGTGSAGTGSAGTGSASGLCTGLDFLPGEAADGTCEPEGWFAIKATYDVWWDEDNASTSSDNRGTYTTYLLQHASDYDAGTKTAKTSTQVCKEDQPPSLSDTLCRAFSTVVAEATWAKIAPAVSTATYTCLDKDAGCTVTSPLVTNLTGVEMTDPAGAWPATAEEITCAAGTGAVCFTDVDGDGRPGISAGFKTTGEYTEHSPCSNGNTHVYSNAPPDGSIGAILNISVSQVHAGTRARMGIPTRTVGSSCGCFTADGVVEKKDTRVLTCRAVGFGTERACTPDEADFIDSRANKHINEGADQGMHIGTRGQVPDSAILLDSHDPSPGPVFRVLRIAAEGGPAPTCADVLGATYPEP